MHELVIRRSVSFPDPLRVGRYKSNPDLGPRLLFFSGGTALNGISRALKSYSFNSVHLVTPFDSGGSSQALRKAFDMPAIGDLRSRLMALADESVLGHPEVFELFTHRFKKSVSKRALTSELETMVAGTHPLVKAIERPMRTLIMHQLGVFQASKPSRFDLRGASIGNLILAGGYLNQQKELEPIIFLVSKLVGVQGIVRAIVDGNLHLGADLEDGRSVIGQHLLTGKETAPIESPIANLYLSKSPLERSPVSTKLSKRNKKLITSADLICYPPGSFYSSVLANILPEGVGKAIASRDVPKVFVPSLGDDPEAMGLSVAQKVQILLRYLKKDAGTDISDDQLLNLVLLDAGEDTSARDLEDLAKLGIPAVALDLVSRPSAPYYDPHQVCEALLSLT
ncbi:GAK system CofD-like protein [Roseibium polysiphoniae]|uniref:GAK system CofD-like protein n=1 Tax=Roseibium polysiphoniae TaxID=2571221 RepID=A0ABR9CB14_9HYPH|nr:GAK system CofD-like protein [Roseibium polysiphoniae]